MVEPTGYDVVDPSEADPGSCVRVVVSAGCKAVDPILMFWISGRSCRPALRNLQARQDGLPDPGGSVHGGSLGTDGPAITSIEHDVAKRAIV